MLFIIRYVLAVALFHPLEGITLGAWLRLLRRERFRVNVLGWPKAAWLTATSAFHSLAARQVERRHGRRIEATRVEAPVFILGHYRSGTTYLHEVLACDPRFASPTRFQAYNPSTFLATERWLAPLVEPFMLPRRVQEDEVALMTLSGLSPYLDWVFPRSRLGYARYSTLRDASPAEVSAWTSSLTRFLKSLTIRHARPLILKSPPHTGRIRPILAAFPDARFVHIRRDPYAVFVSTVGLLKALPPIFGLQWGRGVDVDGVLQTYRDMYDAYLDDVSLVPAGQLVEVAYEDLERDPVGTIRSIYSGIGLGDFEEARPAIEAYLGTVAGYKKNRHPVIDEATRARIASAWSRCFEAWGYPR